MDSEKQPTTVMLIGSIIGAVLGAGVAYLLITAPSNLKEAEESKPISFKDLVGLTKTAASLIRKLDNLRRKI